MPFIVCCAHPFMIGHMFKFSTRIEAVKWAYNQLKLGWEIIEIEHRREWEDVK